MREPDYRLYMDLQQMINLKLIDEMQKLGVSFAFPTRTVQVVRTRPPEAERPGAGRAGTIQ